MTPAQLALLVLLLPLVSAAVIALWTSLHSLTLAATTEEVLVSAFA
jgi:hypothetical protein